MLFSNNIENSRNYFNFFQFNLELQLFTFLYLCQSIDVICYLVLFFNQLQNNSKIKKKTSSSVIDCLQQITFNKPSETFLSFYFYPKGITYVGTVCSQAADFFVFIFNVELIINKIMSTSDWIMIDKIYWGLSYTVSIAFKCC